MYLSRFGVKNYKCLGEIDIPLTPIHVLIGQNDCGKTSLLEAMAAYCSAKSDSEGMAFPEPWIGRDLVWHGSDRSQIELWGEWVRLQSDHEATPYPTFRYGLSISFPLPEHHTCLMNDRWIEVDGEKRPMRVEGRSVPKAVLAHLGDDSRAVSRVLKPVHTYAFDARQMVLPAVFDSGRRFRLDSDGFGLATLLDDILGFDPKVFLDIREEFCRLFPQFRSVRVVTEYAVDRRIESDGLPQSSRRDGKGITFEMQSGKTIRARHASDGAVLLLGLVALAHLPEPPQVLLLEEPENGVYPMRLEQIIRLLRSMVDRVGGTPFPQIILTTHSPYVLSFFQPDEVTLLSRPEGEPDAPVRARPLRDAPDIRERMGNDFYLGELWYNLSEGELFGDAPAHKSD
jgi:hypothetical protein